jgi:ABC-type transport system involved in cytochrome bd biosynthesis fused ATPase/permease subunit
MIITKKHTLYGVFALVIALTIAGVFVLQPFVKPSSDTTVQPNNTTPSTQTGATTAEEATAAIANAKKARAAGKFEDAKTAYQKARQYYEKSNDTQKIADVDAALSLLEAEKSHTPVIVKPPLAGQ